MQKIKSQVTYTAKQTKQIANRATENVLLIVMAILSDKYKFDGNKLEDFMCQVQFASQQVGYNLNRTEILEIIKRHTGYDV